MPKLTEIGLMLHCPSSMDCWDSFLIMFFWKFLAIHLDIDFHLFYCASGAIFMPKRSLGCRFLASKGVTIHFSKKERNSCDRNVESTTIPRGQVLVSKGQVPFHCQIQWKSNKKSKDISFQPFKNRDPSFFSHESQTYHLEKRPGDVTKRQSLVNYIDPVHFPKNEDCKYCRTTWIVTLPSNSHQQDHYIFSRGSKLKPSFATITGKGTTQNTAILEYIHIYFNVWSNSLFFQIFFMMYMYIYIYTYIIAGTIPYRIGHLKPNIK